MTYKWLGGWSRPKSKRIQAKIFSGYYWIAYSLFLEADYCGLSLEINSHDVSVKEVKCECAYYGRYKKVAGLGRLT